MDVSSAQARVELPVLPNLPNLRDLSGEMTIAIAAPVPESQESIFSFSIVADTQMGSQDLILAAEAERVLQLNDRGPSGVSISEAVSTGGGIEGIAGDGEPGGQQRNQRSSASARALRIEILQAPPPPLDANIVAFPCSQITCPLCGVDRGCFSTAPGFMRHLTVQHGNQTITQGLATVLRALDRAICSVPQCGGLRRIGMSQCNSFHSSVAPRPLQVGDIIPGPLAGSIPRDTGAAAQTNQHGSRTASDEDVVLPYRFTERVRLLPRDTNVHVPAEATPRFTRIWARAAEGLADGMPGWSTFEEGRSKLLPAAILQGAHVLTEVNRRMQLIEAVSYA